MSISRDRARYPHPGSDGPDDPHTQPRRFASQDGLGKPDAGATDPTLSDVAGGELSIIRQPFLPAAEVRSPAHAARDHDAATPRRPLQKRDVAFLLGGSGLILALALAVTLLVLPPMFSHLPGSSPGAPVAAGTPIATLTPSPPSTASTASTTSATFVARDTTTRGNWKGVYGSAGYIIAGDTQQIPSTIQVTSTQARPYTWARSTADTRALARPENPSLRIAGSWYSHTSFTFEVNITDGHPYQLALYVLDWGHWNLVETASVVDARSGRVLNTQHLSGFGNGEYLVWRVSGHVTIRITNNATGPNNAVVSALFFAHSIPA